MTNQEISQGVELVCNTSKEIKGYYDNPETLIAALNRVPKKDLAQCLEYYAQKSGVIVDLRKEVIAYLEGGEKLDNETLEKFINKHRNGKENQFRGYKQWFSLFYPPLTFFGHSKLRDFIEKFISKIIADLKLEGKVASIYFDFQGPRQQGSNQLWLAVYNKEQESHSSGIQFFVDFYDGEIGYGVYRHSDKTYYKDRVSLRSSEFDYQKMINYFAPEKPLLLANSPKNVKGDSMDAVQKGISESLTENLNVILFGPPGTGKTYELSTYYFNKFTSKKASVSREEFLRSFVADKSWWEIIALVLLDLGKCRVSDINNHELLQLKTSLSNSTTIAQTIWGQLQSHTVESCENVKVSKKGAPLIFNKTDDKLWEVVNEELAQQAPELLEYHNTVKGFNQEAVDEIRRYEFVTFHQSFTYEDFVEGIKPNFNEGENELTYKIEDGVFKKMCLKARKDPDQNYAVFIDEINRGNISQIFGELITLIEEDKREGEENALFVTLPYSKTKFSIPNNLYIIGTMNTADRSVEALDTALRRRFSFIEMPPKPHLIKSVDKTSEGVIGGIDLAELLKVINRRIEQLMDKDHMIGHSYFMNINTVSDLKKAFQNKILPLLQEYFYGDFGKIGLILGRGFMEDVQNGLEEDVFADYPEYDSSSLIERRVLRLKDVVKMNEEEFSSAINILLRK